MTAQHKDIAEAQLHEVKGAAAAAEGLVLTADGLGSTSFETPVGVTETTFIDQFSTAANQLPTGTDAPLLIEFGAASTNGFIDLNVNGTFTVVQSGVYKFLVSFSVGRVSGAGVAYLFVRGLINGTQFGSSLGNSFDGANTISDIRVTGELSLTAGDVITFEVLRDSGGNNDGGLYEVAPTPVDWAATPTARVKIGTLDGWVSQ